MAESWSTTMKGSITKDYSAYKISTGSGNQVWHWCLVKAWMMKNTWILQVSWIELATVEVMKKDSAADVNLAGAVFGIYSDADCKNLITTMPETDSNGKSSATIVKTQDTVYLAHRHAGDRLHFPLAPVGDVEGLGDLVGAVMLDGRRTTSSSTPSTSGATR